MQLHRHDLETARYRKGKVVLNRAGQLHVVAPRVNVSVVGTVRGKAQTSRLCEIGVVLDKAVVPEFGLHLGHCVKILLNDAVGSDLEAGRLDGKT